MSGDPLDQFRVQLDPGACRLANLPERIWLFGGQFTTESAGPPKSLRESFSRQSFSAPPVAGRRWSGALDMPENYNDWWAHSGYDDLLAFERDACHLARAVILFPESEGALTELGALSIDDSIVDRLLVVVQSKYVRDGLKNSFVYLGPLTRAEKRNNLCVIGVDKEKMLPPGDFDAITEFLDAKLVNPPVSAKLRPDDPTHRLLLVADLVDLFLVSRPVEVHEMLKLFGVTMTEPELERATKLLAFFRLIRIEKHGLAPYLVRQQNLGKAWVNYAAKEGQPAFDRSRFKIARDQFLKADARRKSILERVA